MAYELREGQGTIFRNKFHEEGSSKPHWKGEAMWRGEKVEIALWEKHGAQAGTFFSMKMQEPREKPEETAARQAATPSPRASAPVKRNDMNDDEIPF